MEAGSSKGNFFKTAVLLLPHKIFFRAFTHGFFKVLIGMRSASITKAITHKRRLTEMLRAVKIWPKLCKDSRIF